MSDSQEAGQEKIQTVIPQNQAWDFRSGVMEKLISAAFKTPIKALEVGVWYGVGSTRIWLNCLAPNSELLLVDSWRPYSSHEDLEDKNWDYKQSDDLSTDAFLSAFLSTKKFESENREKNIGIHLTRGDSSRFLPMLAGNSFDFIYIDGDHKYEKVKSDIQQSKRLIKKDFGIICGDDLEKLPDQDLIQVAGNFKNRDYLRDPHYFHPGVLLAVAEEFTSVNMVSGFWWIVCHNGEFTTEVFRPVYSQP